WDGVASHLKPAAGAALAGEVARLAGGVEGLVARARELAARDDLALASHLIDWAVQAAPDDRAAHALRAEIYTARAAASAALMTRGIFTAAAQDSAARIAPPPAQFREPDLGSGPGSESSKSGDVLWWWPGRW